MTGIFKPEATVCPRLVQVEFAVGAIVAAEVAVFGHLKDDLFNVCEVVPYIGRFQAPLQVDHPGRLKKSMLTEEPVF
jgi:hypothetical protein